ncbi:MAG: sulfatase-like hydrolase/transferase, partial [Phycisphaerae bacterium]
MPKLSLTVAPCLVVALLICGCNPGSDAQTPPPVADGPNILLITVESLRPDHVGCYGGPLPTTPAIDALAAESITFDNAYSVTSWTLAAHASLFTGLYPAAANVVLPKHRLDDSYTTLAELLADRG